MRRRQELQEEMYVFPYHYLDLGSEEHRLLWYIVYQSYLKLVKDLLRPFEGQTILDAGCGDGRFCYEMKNENVKMVGVDISEKAVAFARVFNPTVEFQVMDIADLNFPRRFDQVVLIETLEHIPPKRMGKVLESISTSLKKRGKLVITVPTKNLKLREGSSHYWHFTEGTLIKTLEKYFKVEEIYGHTRIGWRKNLFFLLLFLVTCFGHSVEK